MNADQSASTAAGHGQDRHLQEQVSRLCAWTDKRACIRSSSVPANATACFCRSMPPTSRCAALAHRVNRRDGQRRYHNPETRREVLGLTVRPSEAEPFRPNFLRGLASRGTRGVKLVNLRRSRGPACRVTLVLHPTAGR